MNLYKDKRKKKRQRNEVARKLQEERGSTYKLKTFEKRTHPKRLKGKGLERWIRENE